MGSIEANLFFEEDPQVKKHRKAALGTSGIQHQIKLKHTDFAPKFTTLLRFQTEAISHLWKLERFVILLSTRTEQLEHDANLLRWHSSRGFVCHVSPRLKYFSTLRIEAWQAALRCMTACLCCFLATTLSEDTPEPSGCVPSACQLVSPRSDVRRLSVDPR